jgi:hypothetical protein
VGSKRPRESGLRGHRLTILFGFSISGALAATDCEAAAVFHQKARADVLDSPRRREAAICWHGLNIDFDLFE